MRNLLRALQHRNYRLFYGGQAVSVLGLWMQAVALPWLTYRLTDSAAVVGLVVLAQQGPGLLIGPFAGALADRHSKRRMLVMVHLLLIIPSALLGALTLAGVVRVWQVVALAFGMGLCRAFEIPTRQSFVPELVSRDDLPNAIALNSALFNSARLVGPAVGGIVIAQAGEGWCFLANAISFLPIIAALLAMRLAPRPVSAGPSASLWSDVRHGLRYVRGQPVVWALLGGLAVTSLAGMPYAVLLPSFVRRVLGLGPEVFGYLNAAVGLGAIASALALAARASRRGARGLERWLVGGGALFGAALLALAQARSFEAALVVLVVAGSGVMVQMASTNTLLQLSAPDELRGRVMSLHSALFLGVLPLGGVIAGAVADRIGVPIVIAVGGALVLCGALGFGRVLRRRRDELAVHALDPVVADGGSSSPGGSELRKPAARAARPRASR